MSPEDPNPLDAAPPRRRGRGLMIALLVAFLGGVALMAWLVGAERLREVVADEGEAPAATAPPPPRPVVRAAPPAIAPPANPDTLVSTDALDERVAGLEARIEAVGRRAQAAAGDAERAEALLVAFAARRAIDGGIGLGYLEGQLRERFGASQPRAVGVVLAAAREPVTIEDLQLGLEQIAPALATGGPDESWWTGVRRDLAELVTIRRVGAASPIPGERLRRARAMLRGGRVGAAMAEVSRMPGREAAAEWLTTARRYVAARRALDVIETSVLTTPRTPPAALDPAPAADQAEPG